MMQKQRYEAQLRFNWRKRHQDRREKCGAIGEWSRAALTNRLKSQSQGGIPDSILHAGRLGSDLSFRVLVDALPKGVSGRVLSLRRNVPKEEWVLLPLRDCSHG